MKVLIFVIAALATVTGEFCYSSTKLSCQQETIRGVNCTASYGLAHNYMRDLQIYANMHITRNFQYLLMSSHFGNYKKNRDGLKKLFKKLSDTAWEDAIQLIKYIALRGGKMDFHYDESGSDVAKSVVATTELESLAKSLDIQKKLALKAHEVYKVAHRHDPEVSNYIEGSFMQKHAKIVRDLAGYTRDLSRLVEGEKDPAAVGLKLYVLDSYLEKVL